MANVIFAANPEEAASAFFGAANNDALNYIQGSVNNFAQTVGSGARHLADNVIRQYNELTRGATANRINALRMRLNSHWQTNSVRPIVNIADLQQAPDAMVRWIMCEPSTRRKFNNGRCEGYGKRYVDNNPGTVGVDQYDYRVATNGVVVSEGSGEDIEYNLRLYNDTLYNEENDLTAQERCAIAHTHAVIQRALETSAADYTSKEDRQMG